MTEYSVFAERTKASLNANRKLRIRLLGDNTVLLKGKSKLVDMTWEGDTFINATRLEWKYSKPALKPTTRWPWPLRLFAAPQLVEVKEIELYSVTGCLLFRIPLDWPRKLWPENTFFINPGDIKIAL